MCGRFVGFRPIEVLRQHFPIERTAAEVTANYNVAPSQEVLAIVRREDQNWLERLHWGLVPFWAKDPSIGNRLINARAETVAVKPSFRSAFRRRRCLILADGFYEWTGPAGRKQPMFITLPGEEPFAFAGLWENWRRPGEDTPEYRSCTIITTAASPSLNRIHHRMPAVLKQEVYSTWLDPNLADTQALAGLLRDRIQTEFTSRPVSREVNTTRNNRPSCIDPLFDQAVKPAKQPEPQPSSKSGSGSQTGGLP
jgi:putative SOS response-associated peptidase YedK